MSTTIHELDDLRAQAVDERDKGDDKFERLVQGTSAQTRSGRSKDGVDLQGAGAGREARPCK